MEAAQPKPVLDTTTVIQLTPQLLNKTECYCLNEDPNATHQNLFMGSSLLTLRSDADEQLLVHLSFNEFVKIKSIQFSGSADGVEKETNPTSVKVFANRVNMGFSDAEDVTPTDTLELSEEDLSETGKPKDLSFVKFQRVNSITLFFEENLGADITAIGGIKINGMAIQGTNVNEIKKC
ncbi:hypothetical protein ScalyP_jg2747 [Parmales sp. scaly parma]|nr:hypothetical protein ScalyP_jg2747 [Parmales sp. scaly parma]